MLLRQCLSGPLFPDYKSIALSILYLLLAERRGFLPMCGFLLRCQLRSLLLVLCLVELHRIHHELVHYHDLLLLIPYRVRYHSGNHRKVLRTLWIRGHLLRHKRLLVGMRYRKCSWGSQVSKRTIHRRHPSGQLRICRWQKWSPQFHRLIRRVYLSKVSPF